VRELRRGEAIGKVLNDLAVLPDIRGPVADYLTNTYLSKGAPKDFEIAWQPQSLVGIDRSKWNNPYGYSRHLGRPDATIKERVVDMVQTKALAAAKGMPPEQFKARMREEARRQLAEGFAGIEVAEGSKLAQLRDEVEVSAARCVTAAKVQTGPAVADGLSGGYWAKAAREGDFKQYATHESVPTRTEFAACHDGKYLYIGIWCYQPRAETEAKKGYSGNEGNPWSDAGIELFINRTEPGSVRYQLAFNAAGGVVGISDATAMQSPWVCPDLTCGTQIGDDVWTLVARIPFASLGIDPAVDKTIRLQVVRNRPPLEGPQEISSWYPSSFSGHFISGRGLLILE